MEERKMKLADNAFPISSEEILRQNQEFRKNGKYSRKIERAVSVSINALEKFKNKKELTKEELEGYGCEEKDRCCNFECEFCEINPRQYLQITGKKPSNKNIKELNQVSYH